MGHKDAFFKIGDVVLIALMILLAAFTALYFAGREDSTVVSVRTETGTRYYDLDSDAVIDIESGGHKMKLVISDGYAHVEDSDCPDKICEATGKIGKDGGTIVCVPAKVIIKTEGGDGDEIDWTVS